MTMISTISSMGPDLLFTDAYIFGSISRSTNSKGKYSATSLIEAKNKFNHCPFLWNCNKCKYLNKNSQNCSSNSWVSVEESPWGTTKSTWSLYSLDTLVDKDFWEELTYLLGRLEFSSYDISDEFYFSCCWVLDEKNTDLLWKIFFTKLFIIFIASMS